MVAQDGLGRRQEGQSDLNLQSALWALTKSQGADMCAHNRIDKREAKTHIPGTCARFVEPDKRLECLCAQCFWNSRAMG